LKKCYREENDFSKKEDFNCEKQKKIQERNQKKKDREERRKLKKSNKDDKKQGKHSDRKDKSERKELRRDKKRARTSLWQHFSDPKNASNWEGITEIYIDGESLFHTCKTLRQYSKKTDRKGHDAIIAMVQDYAKLSGINTVLIFKDKMEEIHDYEEDMKDDEYKFRVMFANPSHQNPADLMVAISTKQNDDAEKIAGRNYALVSNSIVLVDLIQSGMKIFNPRKFMWYMADLLGKDKKVSTCSWIIEKIGAEISAEDSVLNVTNQVQKVSIDD